MNILITGSRGFVGGRLSTFLVKKGYKVTKLSRYNKQGFKKINWNSDKQLAKVCRGKDVLINCLGVDINHANDFKKANLVNSFLPKKLLSIADKQGVKYFIFLSTYHVYDLREKQINEYSKIKEALGKFSNMEFLSSSNSSLKFDFSSSLFSFSPSNLSEDLSKFSLTRGVLLIFGPGFSIIKALDSVLSLMF